MNKLERRNVEMSKKINFTRTAIKYSCQKKQFAAYCMLNLYNSKISGPIFYVAAHMTVGKDYGRSNIGIII